MDIDYWQKQDLAKPLFPDLIWSRPENGRAAGRLLIIGGEASNFSDVARAYGDTLKAGIGEVRVIVPDSLTKTIKGLFPEAEFVPSNPSGGLALAALGEIIELAGWADGILLAGNLGKNSETQMLIDSLITKYQGILTISGDSADFFLANPHSILTRDNTLLIPSFGQLQKIAAKSGVAITSNLGPRQIVEKLHELTLKNKFYVATQMEGQVFVAANGQVLSSQQSTNQIDLAARATVWWLQNPAKPLEAISSSLVA
jgi:NAD(P)H-hydrate repair Nnr-like enzyme with NAD(P)H-hydrate dehydratase domain